MVDVGTTGPSLTVDLATRTGEDGHGPCVRPTSRRKRPPPRSVPGKRTGSNSGPPAHPVTITCDGSVWRTTVDASMVVDTGTARTSTSNSVPGNRVLPAPEASWRMNVTRGDPAQALRAYTKCGHEPRTRLNTAKRQVRTARGISACMTAQDRHISMPSFTPGQRCVTICVSSVSPPGMA